MKVIPQGRYTKEFREEAEKLVAVSDIIDKQHYFLRIDHERERVHRQNCPPTD
jgi:hypothetical protein